MDRYAANVKQFGGYETLVHKGTNSTLIISAAGVGRPKRDLMVFEWHGTFSKATPNHHAIYVKDTSRTWFNNVDGFNELISYIASYVEKNSISEVICFGLSMGAFGAMVIGSAIGAGRVIALSPRTIIGTDEARFDNRLADIMAKIDCFRFTDARSLIGAVGTYDIFFTVDSPHDTHHASRMRGVPNVNLHATFGLHNLGLEMRRRKLNIEFAKSIVEPRMDLKKFGFFEPPSYIYGMADDYFHHADAVSFTERYSGVELRPTYVSSRIAAESKRSGLQYRAHGFAIIRGQDLTHVIGNGWAPRLETAGPVLANETANIRFAVTPEFPGFTTVAKLKFVVPPSNSSGFAFGIRCGGEIIAQGEVAPGPTAEICIKPVAGMVDIDLLTSGETSGVRLSEVELLSERTAG